MDYIEKFLEQNKYNLSYLLLNILKDKDEIDKYLYQKTIEKINLDQTIIPKNFEILEIDYINVLLISDLMDSKTLCDNWNKMSKDNNYKWNKINLVWNEPCDYYCVINNFPKSFEIIPEKTIFFQMNSFDKIIKNIYLDKFKYVGYNNFFLNNFVWTLPKTYQQLLTEKIEKDNTLNNIIMTITDDNYKNLGDIKKVDFIKFLEKKGINIHVYGGNNKFLWKNYKEDNIDKIFNYKYVFNVENNFQKNYCTERLIDGILSESLVFYSGCYNIKEYIDPRAYVYLELSNFEEDFKIIKQALKEDWWSEKIKYIKDVKIKILNELQFFPRLEKIINNEFILSKSMLDNNIEIEKENNYNLNLNFKNFDDYYFYPNKDSYGGDIEFYENRSIQELKDIADNNDKCIAFNTYGYLKDIIVNESNFIELRDRSLKTEGLYVKKSYKDNKNITKNNKKDINERLKDYKFFPKLDHHGDDIIYINSRNLEEMLDFCEKNIDCISFNTIGYMKYNFDENNLKEPSFFSETDGIYLHKERFDKLKQKSDIKYKIFCINLERRKDRREYMKNIFKNLEINNYDFYNAIDGKDLLLTNDIRNIFIGNDFGSRKAVIGCALTHYNIWMELQNSDYDYFIIFEDDIIIDNLFKNIKDIIISLYTKNFQWDLLYLGYTMFDSNLNNNLDIYRKNDNTNSINISKLNLNIYMRIFWLYYK